MRDGIYGQAGIEAAGAWIAARLRPGDAVLLSGPLGAGKSTLARALIRAACGDPALDVPSPSFPILQSYDTGQLALHHYDLWRLDGPDGLEELGWDEARAGVVVVEWPDRLGWAKPGTALELALSIAGPALRRLAVRGWDDRRG